MDWIWSNYHGDLQQYIKSCQKKLELDAVNIKLEAKLLLLSTQGKLVKDPKLQHYIEVQTLNDKIIEKTALILTKHQDFVNNTRIQPTKQEPDPSSLCTSCYSEHTKLRPPQKNKQRTTPLNPPSDHLSSAQALFTGTSALKKNHQLIVDCGATHYMFNNQKHFSTINTIPRVKVSTRDASSSLSAEGIGSVNIVYKLTISQEGKCFSLESIKIRALEEMVQKHLMVLHYTVPKALITKSLENNTTFYEDFFPSLDDPTCEPEPLLIPSLVPEEAVAIDEVGTVESATADNVVSNQLLEALNSPDHSSSVKNNAQPEDKEGLEDKSPITPPRRIKVIRSQHPTLIVTAFFHTPHNQKRLPHCVTTFHACIKGPSNCQIMRNGWNPSQRSLVN
ncbi:hypothetical protein O181_000031 [Austropuccinia psidii MF-1]|uniref:Retrovirus-related Pol polyprotein from transposon TNT 1-94-like beta-barrel domain-containing protein n=1 Tax=Austropuccinia psidii MF-1 TaxID=1389203 RepID=A0A9Q3GB79_9BASI|nr:hypothetical protein [Austropuccinia psidii MF-1]